MAITSPKNFDKEYLRKQVMETYQHVAEDPDADYHFHRGPVYASEYLGYSLAELETLPTISTARFAGVGNPIAIGPINPGETVLDHACGAGMDLLLAAKRVGENGRAIGVDMTEEMRKCARQGAEQAGLSKIVDIRKGMYEELPVGDESVDVVLSNGVVNLAPDKLRVFKEIQRVLKPGGRLYMADVIVQRELTAEARNNPDIWAACIGGALVEHELFELAQAVGLENGAITKRFNCFLNTSAEQKVSKDLFAHGVNFSANKRR